MALIDFFVERGDKDKKKNKPVGTQKAAPVVHVPASPSSVTEFTEHFKQILKDENTRNFPGNDFYEFWLMKNGMSAIPDEGQRYLVAFTGLSAAGMTKDKLLSTAQKYLGVVEREIEEFTSSYNQAYHEDVTKVEETIKLKTQEMNDLSQKIATLNGEIATLREQSMVNSQKLSDKKNGFLLAGNAQKEEIQNEVQKINQYIS